MTEPRLPAAPPWSGGPDAPVRSERAELRLSRAERRHRDLAEASARLAGAVVDGSGMARLVAHSFAETLGGIAAVRLIDTGPPDGLAAPVLRASSAREAPAGPGAAGELACADDGDGRAAAALAAMLAAARTLADAPDGLTAAVLAERLVLLDRPAGDRRLAEPGWQRWLRRYPCDCALGVRLDARGRCVGAVLLLLPADRPGYTAADARVAARLGEVAALAVENARLLTAARRALREWERAEATLAARTNQQAAVAELGRRALEGTEPTVLAREACRLLRGSLRLDAVRVLERGPDGALTVAAAAGPAPLGSVAGAGPVISAGAVVALDERRPVVSVDLAGEDRFAAGRPTAAAARSYAAVVVGHGAQPYGVLEAFAGEPGRIEPDDVSLLEAGANVLAAAVQRRRIEDETRHSALHDGLTGLPNRVLFGDRVQHAVDAARRGGRRVALMLLDLDGFKEVNDALGHDAGDVVLRELATRLRAGLRRTDTVARLGGDEFAVCLPLAGVPGDVDRVAAKLLAAFDRPFAVAGMDLPLSASVGVAVAPDHGSEPGVLLRRADVAMYRAKRGRGGVVRYDRDRDEAAGERLSLLADLRAALDADAMVLYFQPVVRLVDGAVPQVEALVRWEHAERGLLDPAEFVPLAEQAGLIGPLTTRVLEAAVAQAAAWRAGGLRVSVSVNVATGALADPALPAALAGLVGRHGLPPSGLTVEITESALLTPDARAALEQLAATGIALAVDDFGTGYSSLSYLRELPVRYLKVDRSFVTRMSEQPRDLAIVRAIVELGRSLGMAVVAEGVETADVAGLLRELGAPYGQGFLFSEPLTAADLQRWLVSRPAPASPGRPAAGRAG